MKSLKKKIMMLKPKKLLQKLQIDYLHYHKIIPPLVEVLLHEEGKMHKIYNYILN